MARPNLSVKRPVVVAIDFQEGRQAGGIIPAAVSFPMRPTGAGGAGVSTGTLGKGDSDGHSARAKLSLAAAARVCPRPGRSETDLIIDATRADESKFKVWRPSPCQSPPPPAAP